VTVLRITNLIKRYTTPDGTSHVVLDIAHFELAAGQQVALAGASGSGKTTLLHIIAGILRADEGQVFVADQDMLALPEPARDRVRAERIGYVFQTFNLLQGYTALENVCLGMAFGRGVDIAAARHLLERVGLGDRLRYRPKQLSVGQQQRVAVARALAHRPSLLLTDEPTGNLDPDQARKVLTLIRELCVEQGTALLVVSHDRDVLAQFQPVIEIADLQRGRR
jgi:putative ABC transport system ATP-binding protein